MRASGFRTAVRAGVASGAALLMAAAGQFTTAAASQAAARPASPQFHYPLRPQVRHPLARKAPASGHRVVHHADGVNSVTFSFNDTTQYFTVPAGVTSVNLTGVGGAGGAGQEFAGEAIAPGGPGARVSATTSVTPGEQLVVMVGGAGGNANPDTLAGGAGGLSSGDTMNGGAGADGYGGPPLSPPAGGGGGGTEVVVASGPVLLAAGGGGGGGGAGDNANGPAGGGAGGAAGTSSDGGSGQGPTGGSGGPFAAEFNAAGGGGATGGSGGGGGGGGGGGYLDPNAAAYGGGAGGVGGNDQYSGGGGGGAGASYTAPGETNVSVINGASSGDGQVVISWATPPAVAAITPAVGIPAGGRPVTVFGSGFTGATAVSFGGKPAKKFTVLSDTDIAATPPAGAGTVNVTVTTPGGASSTGAAADYTYLANGSLVGWGYDGDGELGNGQDGTSFDTPVAVGLPPGTKVVATALGADTGYALTSAGTVYAWGYGAEGELGNGGTSGSDTPVQVHLPARVKVVALAAGGGLPSGGTTAYALTSTGSVYAWGYGGMGALGNGKKVNSATPVLVKIPAGAKIVAIAAGAAVGYALTSTGAVVSWGWNTVGELGDGLKANSDLPVAVSIPAGVTVTAIAAGAGTGYALTSSGSELAWGFGGNGVLGNGATRNKRVPVRVALATGTKVSAIAAAYFDGYALTSAGSVLAWGQGGQGQLGNGGTSDSTTPVKVALPKGTKVAQLAGESASCLVRTTAGTLLAWGDGTSGNLGNGSFSISDTPVKVALPAGVVAVGIGPSEDGGLAVVNVPPVVTKLSPKTGPAGTKVTITGLDLQHATAVHFGSVAATFKVKSPTTIVATVPAGSGTVDVTVSTPLGVSAKTKADRYTY